MRFRRTALALGSAVSVFATVPSAGVHAATGTITGHLIDADSGNDSGAAGVNVQACTESGCSGVAGLSDTNGSYTITGVAAGTWSIVTNPPTPCGLSDFGRAKVDGVFVSDAVPNPTAPTMTLTRAKGTMAGFVTGNGAPVDGATVFADDAEQGGNGFQTTTSHGGGYYQLDCVPAERGYFITTSPPMPFSHQADSQYTVVAGQTLRHDISLSVGSASMGGYVKCGGAACSPSPANLLVLEFCGLGMTGTTNPCSLYNTSTDSTGYFRTPAVLMPGNYTLHAFAPPGWDNAALFNITLSANQVTWINLNLTQATSDNSGRIVGNVYDTAGARYANCRINLFSQEVNTPPLGQGFTTGVLSDLNGNYDTGYSLTPGTAYRLWLDCPGHPEATTNVDSSGRKINLGRGSTATVNWFFGEPARPWSGGHDAIGVAAPASDAYFAEGTTNLSGSAAFHEYITVQNPNLAAEALHVDYFLGSGAVVGKDYNLPAQSRTTLNVNQEVGPNLRVGARLHSAGTFVAERPMYFMSPGGIKGGDDVMGAQALGNNFYFAEGFTGAGFQENLALLNPDPANPALVNVTYFYSDRGPLRVPHTIPAHSPLSIDVNAEAGAWENVSIQVSSATGNTVKFLAERSMYFPFPAPNGALLRGGDTIVGASAPSQHLNLAEGYAGNGFYEYLTLLNPTSTDTTATITYNLEGGGQKQVSMDVPPNSRQTRLVNNASDLGNAGTANSIHIDSTSAPLVVERPMYFTYQGRTGGHIAMAADDAQLGKQFNFAEGFVNSCSGSPCFDEYYTILNNTAVNANVTITYLLEGGGSVAKNFVVLAHSRYTRWVNHTNDPGQTAPDLPNFSNNSAQITSDQPILVERPMYFNY